MSMNDVNDESYELRAIDKALLMSAESLLRRLTSEDLLRPAQLVSVAKLRHVYSILPLVTLGIHVSVSVTGPRRSFEEIETYHWWEISVEEEQLSITSGGHFYHPSTGEDSFTS